MKSWQECQEEKVMIRRGKQFNATGDVWKSRLSAGEKRDYLPPRQ